MTPEITDLRTHTCVFLTRVFHRHRCNWPVGLALCRGETPVVPQPQEAVALPEVRLELCGFIQTLEGRDILRRPLSTKLYSENETVKLSHYTFARTRVRPWNFVVKS